MIQKNLHWRSSKRYNIRLAFGCSRWCFLWIIGFANDFSDLVFCFPWKIKLIEFNLVLWRSICEVLWEVWRYHRLCYHEGPSNWTTQGVWVHHVCWSSCCWHCYCWNPYHQWQTGESWSNLFTTNQMHFYLLAVEVLSIIMKLAIVPFFQWAHKIFHFVLVKWKDAFHKLDRSMGTVCKPWSINLILSF